MCPVKQEATVCHCPIKQPAVSMFVKQDLQVTWLLCVETMGAQARLLKIRIGLYQISCRYLQYFVFFIQHKLATYSSKIH